MTSQFMRYRISSFFSCLVMMAYQISGSACRNHQKSLKWSKVLLKKRCRSRQGANVNSFFQKADLREKLDFNIMGDEKTDLIQG